MMAQKRKFFLNPRKRNQKRKFFLNPRKRNDAPTVSNTPPTGSNPIGVTDSTRNATTPVLEKIALREM